MLPELIGAFMSMIGYGIVAFAIWKLTQIATELGEIKEILTDIRRNSDNGLHTSPEFPKPAENLSRAVTTASYSEVLTNSEPQH